MFRGFIKILNRQVRGQVTWEEKLTWMCSSMVNISEDYNTSQARSCLGFITF